VLRLLKAVARGALKAVGLYTWYSISTKGPLKDSGWLRSFDQGEPVDAAGGPVPWMVYPAVDFLAPRLHADMSVFEYGSGNSTLWWAARVRELVSCEHDPVWYGKIRARVPANVTMHHVPLVTGGDYSKKVADYRGAFDIVVIDGRDRVHCAINAVPALKPGGVILWDDTYRVEYQEGYDALARAGFRKIAFVGLAPVFNQYGETGIFYRPGNCLGI
jgi:hypothetical protein